MIVYEDRQVKIEGIQAQKIYDAWKDGNLRFISADLAFDFINVKDMSIVADE